MTDKALASLDDRKLEWMQQETCQSRAHTLNHGGSSRSEYETYELLQKENEELRENLHRSANKHKHKEAISTMTKEMRVMSFWGLQVHIFPDSTAKTSKASLYLS